uniref:Reverse transcriptase domain-containing protein n=1 Tax=Tanacetum cinerariifolium TaxID=118510 RepID=A0A6L2N9I5_TANCI|nr:reverse transcriptase domain-containing protein [Tanacetum cinerariifolium]
MTNKHESEIEFCFITSVSSLDWIKDGDGVAAVASPARVLELDTFSSSEADPSKSSPPPVSVAPIISPFLCSDDSESDTEMPERHVSPTPHDDMLTRPYRSLTARKSIRPLTSHRLSLRYTSHHLDHFTSGSLSGHSSLDHSSSRLSISGHSLSGHASPDTTIAASSTPPRFFYPSLARPPRDSSSESSAGPSRKRCRSPAATMTSSINATRALFPSRDDLLPPHKSIKDVEAGVDTCIGMEVNVRIDVEDKVEDEVESSDRGAMEVEEGLQDIYELVTDIPLQRIEDIKMGQRELEEIGDIRCEAFGFSSMMLCMDFRLAIELVGSSSISINQAIEELINQRVEEALAAYEATRAANALEAESQSQNSSDDDNRNGGNGNGRNGNGKNGNSKNGNGGNGNAHKKVRGARPVARETVGTDASFTMSWRELLKLMVKVYCPRNEIQRMEFKLWNLTMKNNDLAAYTQRFQELTMMCTKIVSKEED